MPVASNRDVLSLDIPAPIRDFSPVESAPERVAKPASEDSALRGPGIHIAAAAAVIGFFVLISPRVPRLHCPRTRLSPGVREAGTGRFSADAGIPGPGRNNDDAPDRRLNRPWWRPAAGEAEEACGRRVSHKRRPGARRRRSSSFPPHRKLERSATRRRCRRSTPAWRGMTRWRGPRHWRRRGEPSIPACGPSRIRDEPTSPPGPTARRGGHQLHAAERSVFEERRRQAASFRGGWRVWHR